MINLLLLCAAVCFLAWPPARAEDALPLIKQLASENDEEIAGAIAALQKMGPAAEEPLRKIENDEKLAPRQLVLVRKILGDRVISTTSLQPIDLKSVAAFGEDKEKKIPGDPNLFMNRDTKVIVMNGEFVLEQGPLEYLICVKNSNAKLHETVAGVYARPRDICYALLACNYTYTGEVDPQTGKINLPKEAGIVISIEYEWEPVNAKMVDATGTPVAGNAKKLIRVPIEFFAWNAQTEKTMKQSPFAFTGSKFEKDENGRPQFMADLEMSIVALKFDVYAIMNTLLDTKEIDPQHAAGYSINRYAIPPKGTKCRVIFEPWKGGELGPSDLTDTVKGREQTGVAPPPTKGN
jgi:hypothetical protein